VEVTQCDIPITRCRLFYGRFLSDVRPRSQPPHGMHAAFRRHRRSSSIPASRWTNFHGAWATKPASSVAPLAPPRWYSHDVRPRARPHRRHPRQIESIPGSAPVSPPRNSKTSFQLGALLHRQPNAWRPPTATVRPARRHRHRGIHSLDLLLHHVEEAGQGVDRWCSTSKWSGAFMRAGPRPPPSRR